MNLVLDADCRDAEHDAGDETDGDSDPRDDVRPADVKLCVFPQKRRPRRIKLETLVINLVKQKNNYKAIELNINIQLQHHFVRYLKPLTEELTR